MAKYRVQGPDGAVHVFEGPDDATPDQVTAFAAQTFAQGTPKPPETDAQRFSPTKDMSTTDRTLAGIGAGMSSVGRGALGGIRTLTSALTGVPAEADMLGLPNVSPTAVADRAEAAHVDAPLLATTAGKVGNVVGHVAAAVPAVLLPGGATGIGATAIGAGTGAITTEGGAGDRLEGALEGAVGGRVGKYLGDGLAAGARKVLSLRTAAADTAKAANATRDATLATSRDAGYVVPPSQAGTGGIVNAITEGLGGKIKTAQAASSKNQDVTNTLARQALGLPKDAPMTTDALRAIRSQAGQAYDAVANAGVITPRQTYTDALDAITAPAIQAAKGFPNAKPSPIIAAIDELRSPQFDAASAVAKIKELRGSADAAFASGDKELGRALKSGAAALEGAIDTHLVTSGAPKDLLQNFRDARMQIAKTYSVEKALNASTGNVSGPKLATQLAKGKPLSGDLRTAAEFAQAFPKSAQEGVAVPAYSPLDVFSGGVGLGTGNPALAALFAARPVARAAALSGPYQRTLAAPSYEPGLVPRAAAAVLDTRIARALQQATGMQAPQAVQR